MRSADNSRDSTGLSVDGPELPDESDESARRVKDYFASAKEYASTQFQRRLQNAPEVAKRITDLLQQLNNSISELSAVDNIFEELVRDYIELVVNREHYRNYQLSPEGTKDDATDHVGVLGKIFQSGQKFNKQDRMDLGNALEKLCQGTAQLLKLSQSSTLKTPELNKLIKQLKSKITPPSGRGGNAKLGIEYESEEWEMKRIKRQVHDDL